MSTPDNPSFVIRTAVRADAVAIHGLVRELAVFERMEQEMIASVAAFENTLFAENAKAGALVCSVDDTIVAYAIHFFNYSTWLGQHGLFLEDLYVQERMRGRGVGHAMLSRLAQIALENDCGRFEWNVLRWNAPAIRVYETLGACSQDEWIGYRLTGEALDTLAHERTGRT